jgi:octanoyl-[GcvH]:protein N-octanoyltransferase
VAFAKRDALAPGYADAVEAARAAGFGSVLRLAGGRAAVFHEGTLEVAHAVPDPDPRTGIHARFEATAELVARALARLGLDARVGEVPGEYCPGRWSVNADGARKLAGIGQRVIAGGAHVGTVIVAEDAASVERVLTPVYAALGLDWDPATVGEVGGSWEAVRDAVLDEYARLYDLTGASVDEETLSLARRLAAEHRPPAPRSRPLPR